MTTTVTRAAQARTQIIVWMLLPPIVFSDSFSMDPRVMKRVFSPAVLLAGPGVLLSTLGIGAWIHFTFGAVPGKPELQEPSLAHWPWFSALLLAAVLSATDAPSVETQLEQVGTLGAAETQLQELQESRYVRLVKVDVLGAQK